MSNNGLCLQRKSVKSFYVFFLIAVLVAFGQFARGEMRIRTFEIDGIVWKYGVQGDQAIITSGDTSVPVIPPETRGRVKLPSEIDGFRVKRLDPCAFIGCRYLREVNMSEQRGYLDAGYGLFSGCTSLRRVIFPRDFYLLSMGMPQQRMPLFQDCDSIEEIVFLGRVPNPNILNNLGISLNNRLRFTERFEKQWRIYVEDYNVTGWAIWDESKNDEDSNDVDTSDEPSGELDFSLAEYTSNDPKMATLVKLSSDFKGYLESVEAAYEKSHAELVRQRADTLRKGRAMAQQSGDLDAVITFDKALESEEPFETDNETLLAIFAQFAAAVEKNKKTRDDKYVKLVESLFTRLGSIKVKETKAGNFAVAKEAKTYEDRVKPLLDDLHKRVKGPSVKKPARTATNSNRNGGVTDSGGARRPSDASPESNASQPSSGLISVPGAMQYRVSVAANDEKGAFIGGGSFEKGDLLIIQYMGGEMTRYRGSSYEINPDKQESYYYYDGDYTRSRTHSFVKIDGPNGSRTKVTRQLPYDTEKSPYVFEVPESGRYRLIGFLTGSADGKASYQVLRITKFNSQSFRNSAQAKRCRW